mmetsp:Transcript_68920/g.165414  ORF Transcript_68920/g.165414 Transcript_68920/m.165414 type:complete len:305 (+) Transcript_68920:110-1024(+)|eukprot:CAMPEP_0178388146 /NCGR_PEP_ID=MMETSP0689_2-20121128/9440_1 /TAXON_ID=160604 /ORGANISM="Amphidinium massartii, Strain CS-259" /LENGTH=304 /DNA_ID=CAMNT_0020008535 /DNA_START=59 /DNA_END=973 /DNA_ORIENTATION=-
MEKALDANSGILTASSAKPEEARALMRRLAQADCPSTCAVVRALASPELLTASRRLCEAAPDTYIDMNFWQGHLAQPDEPVLDQFLRQLGEDLDDLGEAAVKWLSSASGFMETLLEMYDRDCLVVGSPNRFHLRVQLNMSDACDKFHDDKVAVRYVTTLCGDSTVVAPDDRVDWAYWKQTGGQVVFTDNHGSSSDADANRRVLLGFNGRICPPEAELHPSEGDLLMLKGGELAPERPCVHRAPYSAGIDSEEMEVPPRLLITLDHISPEACDMMIAMDAENNEEDESEVEDESAAAAPKRARAA